MGQRELAVVTIKLGTSLDELATLTTPFMQKYASKVGADFLCIENLSLRHNSNEYSAYWAKFQLFDVLASYDRLIYLDLDTLVYPHCPNLFEIVPESRFGALFESDYGVNLDEEIQEYQTRAPNIGWFRDYFNVGVMIISKGHKQILEFSPDIIAGKCYPEQTPLNYRVQKEGVLVFKLGYEFNHMWFLCPDKRSLGARLNSNIYHYASIPHDLREILIAEDIRRYRNGREPVQRHELKELFLQRFSEEEIGSIKKYRLLKNSANGLE